ncbi:hypothetical protein H105_00597 [Trichophyton soudanense CBS 452.61]|uniref:Uncharacterized protein n=1 Tax=Trichophyton soudanense CBS 452.61 TaxID=1215331 RepID=A0A022Y689_TRISD|nr:hypothetical protein H105_00597 [Trichophyton soudanense CBS 452.61]
MHIPVFLLFPILVLANPAPISPAPKNPLGSLQARSANYCCHPFPPGSNVSLLEKLAPLWRWHVWNTMLRIWE